MFGFHYLKAEPTTYVLQYHAGKLVRKGAGLAFWYYAPRNTIATVPLASQDAGFMLELVTNDFQTVTVQGEVNFQISDPDKTASLMDFSLNDKGQHQAQEQERLHERVTIQAKIIIQQAIQSLSLREALQAPADIASQTHHQLAEQAEIQTLGLAILGVSVVAIRPTKDIARALEAEGREANLKNADDAVYQRRMSAVENERSIQENELDTAVAVEEKQRQIQETRMAGEVEQARHKQELQREQMQVDIDMEQKRQQLVEVQSQNTRVNAEAEAYRLQAVMNVLDNTDPKILQALTASRMQPEQLIAQAFNGLAERAEHIGQLNISPDLLQGLMDS